MMNWLWAIPWAVILVFAAGWMIGGRFMHKHKFEKFRDRQTSWRNWDEAMRRIDDLECSITKLQERKTKEDKNNG